MRWVPVPVAIAASLAFAAPAFGHAAFAGSDPSAGARVETSPARVTLVFTEPLEQRLAKATIERAGGGRVPAAQSFSPGGERILLAPAQPLGTGAYVVHWHTVSDEDGHALEGAFSFGVRAAPGASAALETGPLARAGIARILARLALYVTLLTLVAALLGPLLVRRPAGWPVPDAVADDLAGGETTGAAGAGVDLANARGRYARLTGDLAWLAVAAAVASALADAADAAAGVNPSGISDFLLAGLPGAARVAVVVALVAAALLHARAPRVAAGAAVLALGALAASGHAAAAEPRTPSILNDWLHLVSGAVWLGGIALLVLVWWPVLRFTSRATRLAVARRVLAPFGPVALGAFAVAVATGLVSLLTELGRIPALWETSYGRVLALKMVAVGAIAAVSWMHALRLRPRLLAANPHPEDRLERRHWRLWRNEPWLGLVVVGAVAGLVAFPLPPRQLAEAASGSLVSACDPCPLPKPAPDELGVAAGAGPDVAAAWVRRTPQALTGTVRLLDRSGKPSRTPFRLPGASGTTDCGPGCRRFRLPAAARSVTVAAGGATTLLPARWDAAGSRHARQILDRAEATMRGLTGVRELERLTSGPGTSATTEYRLRAPDRLAWVTGRGVRSVVVGKRQWTRTPELGWRAGSYGSGLAFRTRSWFRWKSYARTVRLLGERSEGGRRLAEIALMDEGTPVWFRLEIDEGSHRVLRERLTAPARFGDTRFVDFGHRFAIRPPAGVP